MSSVLTWSQSSQYPILWRRSDGAFAMEVDGKYHGWDADLNHFGPGSSLEMIQNMLEPI